MALDYDKVKETVHRLVSQNGRIVTFLKYDDIPDSDPWGEDSNLRDPANTLELPAVSVHPTDVNVLGIRFREDDLLFHLRALLLVAPGEYQGNLADYQEVIDGGKTFRISFMEELKPATTRLLWYAGLTE